MIVDASQASDDGMFRAVTDAAPVTTWLSDPEGRCTYISRSWLALTGQTEAQALGSGWLQAIHPEDRARVSETFERAARNQAAYQVEYRVRSPSGDFVWVLDSAAPLAGEGQSPGYVGSIVLNDARKQAEIGRDRSERRLRVALQAANIGIWEWDLASNTFEFSDRALGIFGFLPTDGPISFDRLVATIHPDDLQGVQEQSDRALDPAVRAREPYRYRIIRANDGALRWIRAHGEAVFSEGPAPVARSYIGTFQDITEDVERERQLFEQANRLKLAIEAAGLAVWELDVAGNRLTPSPELNRLYGFPEDAEPSVEEFQSRYAPGELERLARLGAEAQARGEQSIRVEVRHILPGDEERWLLVQAQTAPPFSDGRPRVIGVAMDVTARKHYETRLELIARELQHRVKNSLTVVQTLVNQSFRGDRTLAEGREVFTSRLMSMARTTELLTRSHGTAASLTAIVQRAVEPFSEADARRFSLSGPEANVPAKMSVALGMALHELCTNAMKYGALSTPTGRVDVSWAVDNGRLDLLWREQGGPPVVEPRTTGFGSRLLRGSLLTPHEGTVALHFKPEGVECRISMNLAAGTQ